MDYLYIDGEPKVLLAPGTQFRTAKYVGTVLEVTLDSVKFKENGSKSYVRKTTPFAFWRGITAGLIELIDPAEKLMEDLDDFVGLC